MGPEWKYHITLFTPDWHIIERWCQFELGEFDDRWYKLGIDPAEYLNTGLTRTVWYFKEEKDAALFALRWA